MPRRNGRVPSYRLHKPSGQARVIINGEHLYLGKFGSPESREKYARLIAELAAGNGPAKVPTPVDGSAPATSVDEVLLEYWRFAKAHYAKNGTSTGELENIRAALRPVRKLYGESPAREFGPKNLKAVRQHMIDAGLSRKLINSRVGRIKRFFKWAASEQLVPPSVYHGLQAVTGLTFGRTKARETEPIRPAPDLSVATVVPFVSPQVGSMIKVQRLTGMRSGELVLMRPCDIDTSGDVWVYEPADHKTRWRGHGKQIPLDPEVQKIIQPFLDRDPDAFLFSPQEADEWRKEHAPPYHGRQRKTKVYPCELRRRQKEKLARRRRKPKRPKRNRYDTNTYRRAIEYGMKKARKAGFVIPHWHPHQLRHTRGTEVRRQHGIEAAQVALGHARADVTQVYAERNHAMAIEIAKKMG